MKSRTVHTLLASLSLAALTACGGSGGAVVLTASGQAQFAAAAPASAPAPENAALPVASACNAPACPGGADGLADQFRAASMERAAQADAAEQPGYPNVPSNVMTVSEAQAPEVLGTATMVRAR